MTYSTDTSVRQSEDEWVAALRAGALPLTETVGYEDYNIIPFEDLPGYLADLQTFLDDPFGSDLGDPSAGGWLSVPALNAFPLTGLAFSITPEVFSQGISLLHDYALVTDGERELLMPEGGGSAFVMQVYEQYDANGEFIGYARQNIGFSEFVDDTLLEATYPDAVLDTPTFQQFAFTDLPEARTEDLFGIRAVYLDEYYLGILTQGTDILDGDEAYEFLVAVGDPTGQRSDYWGGWIQTQPVTEEYLDYYLEPDSGSDPDLPPLDLDDIQSDLEDRFETGYPSYFGPKVLIEDDILNDPYLQVELPPVDLQPDGRWSINTNAPDDEFGTPRNGTGGIKQLLKDAATVVKGFVTNTVNAVLNKITGVPQDQLRAVDGGLRDVVDEFPNAFDENQNPDDVFNRMIGHVRDIVANSIPIIGDFFKSERNSLTVQQSEVTISFRYGDEATAFDGHTEFYFGISGDDDVSFGSGHDTAGGGLGDDRLLGEDGDDALFGGPGDDTLEGGAGADDLAGDGGNDTLIGGGAGDTISGGGGDDVIEGNGGLDLLRGGAGDDRLFGNGGADVMRGQKDGDHLDGGFGDDNLKGGGGNDTIIGGEGDDFINGGSRKDVLSGGLGNDRLIGRSFDDTLTGGAGNDTLLSGGENDRLIGGSGNDVLKGGDGADVFVFDVGFDADRLLDFSLADDRLEISAALAAGRSATQIAASAQADTGDTLLDFGSGDVLRLVGVDDTSGLSDQIEIV